MFKAKQKFTAVLVACVMMIASLVMAVATLVVAPQTAVAEPQTDTITITGTTGTLASDSLSIAWEGTNISVVNYKGSSSTAIRTSDSAHFRVYVGNKTTFSSKNGEKMTQIVITAVSGYVFTSGTCGSVDKGSVTTSGTTVTITFSEPVEECTISTSKQWRLSKAAVTYEVAGDDEIPQASLKLTGTNYTQVGGELTLNAEPKNFEVAPEIEWASDNEEVATVVDGVVTAKAMGKATITASAGDVEDTMEVKVFPAETELTVAEALEVCAIAGDSNSPYKYSVTGNITAINTAYDSGYGNITVTIADNTGSIKAYRMEGGSDLVVGMNLTVTGNLVTYGTTPEFNQGCTYVLNLSSNQESIQEELNTIQSSMSLSYKYTEATEEVAVTSEVVDTLNNAWTGISGTNYSAWSGKEAPSSSAVYAGNCAGDKTSIQLRTNNNNSGVVTTVSGGKATKITVVFHADTTAGRELNVYGKHTAYEAATDLYATETAGDHLTTMKHPTKGTATTVTFEITGDYEYIGFKSKSGALYLTSVEITWATGAGAGEGTTTQTVYKNSDFRFRFSVSDLLADFDGADGVEAWGIKVSAGDKEMYFTEDSEYWVESAGSFYVVISLGDIINDKAKLQTEFTVEAYVVVDGVTLTSELSTSYSVVSMVARYVDVLEYADVEPLYDILANKGLI